MSRYIHRCTGPAADHCRKCSYLPEDDECQHDETYPVYVAGKGECELVWGDAGDLR